MSTKPASVKAEIARLRETARRALDKIGALQKSCPHPGVSRTPKSDVGNYDPSADSYWYVCECPECGKCWAEDQ